MIKITFRIFCLLIFSVPCSFGQTKLPIDSTTNKVTYVGSVDVPGASKERLYNIANAWFREFGKGPQMLDNSDTLIAQIRGSAWYPWAVKLLMSVDVGNIHYSISISTKDGKYRYELTDFYFNDDGKSAWGYAIITNSLKPPKFFSKKSWEQLKRDTDMEAKIAVETLKNKMLNWSQVKDW